MSDFTLTTPVAFFVFNRPDTTKLVFDEIRKAKPTKLLLVADGPRPTRPDDQEKCAATRAILDQVDWDCQIYRNFSDTNMGCKIRMASGLDWVFDTVEEAIILEHDTLPHPSFFRFSQELLEKYRTDERIMMISGCNFQFGNRRTDHSYYFSKCVHCWGWATWRRAWQKYDLHMKLWPEFRDGGWINDVLVPGPGAAYWQRIFDLTYRGYVDTWDYQWVFSCSTQNALNIQPNVNLISNIGFGADATHTGNKSSRVADMSISPMEFPLKHPSFMVRDSIADQYTQQLYNTGEM